VEEKWGRRKMAYPIQKQQYANYVLLDYVGPAELPAELERIIRLDDRFIRFLTVRIDEDIVVDDIREAAQTRHKRRVERMSVS
jgi:small subunit ribosomal protein S6